MSSKTDYVYDAKDKTILQSALRELKTAESSGYTRAVVAGFAVYGGLRLGRYLTAPGRTTAALLSALTYYSVSTHKPRRDYENVALRVNGKVSQEINQMMNFK